MAAKDLLPGKLLFRNSGKELIHNRKIFEQCRSLKHHDIPSLSYSSIQSIILSPLHLFLQLVTMVYNSKVSKCSQSPFESAQKFCEQSNLTKPSSIVQGTTQCCRGWTRPLQFISSNPPHPPSLTKFPTWDQLSVFQLLPMLLCSADGHHQREPGAVHVTSAL